MKRLATALIILACVLPLQADILANSTFADGRAHWNGDGQDAVTPAGAELTDGSPPSGLLINLKKDKWAKIFQDISVRGNQLYFSLKFALSADYKPFPAQPAANGNLWLNLSDLGFSGSLTVPERHWQFVIVGPRTTFFAPVPVDPAKSSPQTITGKFPPIPDGMDAVFILAIPAGEGSVTLLNLSLTPDNPDN
jgi:hypothetical protein